MKPFHMIALPHRDVLEGRHAMDIYAADLWKVFKGATVEDYMNPDSFFQKTYLTFGLKNLLKVAGKRLKGKGGDSVIQLQTPFGGGKTHSLIALYHAFTTGSYFEEAVEANVTVFVGTAISPNVENGKITGTVWGELERQLEGEVKNFDQPVAPGRDKLEKLLEKHQPLLILIDELLQYTTKAAGVKVEDSTLASQTIAFMQELTECVQTLDKTLLVLTLPSGITEHYDESAERLFVQLKEVPGRTEKVYTPVAGEEIYEVVRRRLFREIDENKAKEVVNEYLNYYEREGIIQEKSEYREKMLKSYPFHPEVIDVLHDRWGSIPTFQRTRGVLRILSLAIYRLKDSSIPLICPCDLDLSFSELSEELIKHIGREFESVLSADITGSNANANKIDESTGVTYQGLKLGSKLATAIFLYSFSGGERGATLGELKLTCSNPNTPSSVITDVIEGLKNTLFYLHSDTGKYFFTSQPNLNSILVTRMSEIENGTIREATKSLLDKYVGKDVPVYKWIKDTKDVPDTEELKLVVLPKNDENVYAKISKEYGESPRVNKNTVIFLCPMESERHSFENWIRKFLAWQKISEDNTLNLTEQQRKTVKEKLKELKNNERFQLRSLYRLVYTPSRDGFKEIDLGYPVYGKSKTLCKEVVDGMKSEGELLEKLTPLLVSEKYLSGKEYIGTNTLYKTILSTPGEPRVNKKGFVDSIKDGVKQGTFGLGVVKEGNIECLKFKESPDVSLSEYEVIISKEICEKFKKAQEEEPVETSVEGYKSESKKPVSTTRPPSTTTPSIEDKDKGVAPKFKEVKLNVRVPKGKFSEFYKGVILPLENSFGETEIKLEIKAKDGEILKSDYEDKIQETLYQINAKFDEALKDY